MARIIFGMLFGAFAMSLPTFSDVNQWGQLTIFLGAYVIAGGDVLLRAFRNIFRGQVLDENFLMSIATIGAFVVGEYLEGVAVMIFYQIGELFQDYAVGKSRASISDLMDIRPDYANVKRGDGILKVDPYEVELGETIVIRPGERVPLDGVVIDGHSMLDTSALTGESVPRDIEPGSEVLSGCINTNGLLTVTVTKNFEESTVSKILDMVENASSKKAKAENFITKFAKYYTPIVVISAVLLAVIPPMVLGIGDGAIWMDWVTRALSFLVISCPCALVISVPLGFFGGIGGASRVGVLVKGSNYLEAMAKTEIVVFDKTGTLTKGTFSVTNIQPSEGMEPQALLDLAAHAESNSSHPISLSLQKAYGKVINPQRVGRVEEVAGHGVKAQVDGKTVLAGNAKLMEQAGIPYTKSNATGTLVYVAVDGVYAGYLVISDEIKPDSSQAVADLKKSGIRKTVMLTGDNRHTAELVAKQLRLDQVYAELLPVDKVERMEELLKEKSPKGKLIFVGDGINDAPVLARADIGVAMGGLGSDAAIEAADIVIMTDEPSKLATVMRISKKTLAIVTQNIVFAMGIKIVTLVLGAFGIANLWIAVFADVGVAILAILNSIRALRYKGE
ncbi:MAG: cadmium-translocating P-type ATPase [Clostridiales bacterium]|nr:cadmium-translocating P-type ATPase [Clostridiales bacterium]